MTLATLDFYFPFIVFFYGFLVLIVIETPVFQKIAEAANTTYWQTLNSRRPLAWVALLLGGLWSLQNLFM